MVSHHKGISTKVNLKGNRPVQVVNASTLGVVFTAPDADAAKFPLNQPIAMVGGANVLEGMGNTGTGPAAFGQILSEGVGVNAVGIRVEPGATLDATLTNVVGAAGAKTGVHGFKHAKSEVGIQPRIYLAPGFSSQRPGNSRNPVVAELQSMATARGGVVIADGPNTTKEAALQYREDWGSERIYMIDPAVKVFRGGQNVVRPASATVAGIILRTDLEHGPHWSPSNQQALGITGIARPIDYFDGDAATEADYLTRNKIATFIREDGFRLWGNETCWTEPLNKFLPVVRTHDIIIESVERAHRQFRDQPFSVQLLTDIAGSVNGFLRQMKARGWTIGYEVWLDPALNTVETWLNGDLFMSYDAEAPAPLQRLVFMFNRNTDYYGSMRRDAISAIAKLA